MKKALLVLFLQVSFIFAQTTPCVPAGDQQTYGSGTWIGYVYDLNTLATFPPNFSNSYPYKGYILRSDQFDQNLGAGALTASTLCGSYSNKFGIRFKMNNTYTAGYYAITVAGDDGYQLSIDGGATYTISNWNSTGYRTSTKTVFLNGSTSFVYDYFENTGNSRVSFSIVPCDTPSSAPQSISGLATICRGSSVTLTATGGYEKTGAVYQWGRGTVIGSSIIAGQTSASTTVSPTGTTTYWVRRVDAAPCVGFSDAITGVVTVKALSTAPTSISGNTYVCLGGSITLTASGGTAQVGSVFEWGTGTDIGSNIIDGATTNAIIVSPATATTYWVRRRDTGVCTSATTGITKNVDVVIPDGNPDEYGMGEWKGYVYAGNGTAVATTAIFNGVYRGYVTETESFDRTFTTGIITASTLCGTYKTYYGVRYKMNKTFDAGYYNFSMGGDDGFRLSIDGGQTFVYSKWNIQGFTQGTINLYLAGEANLVFEYFQATNTARVKMTVTPCTPSEAPTAVDGVTSICRGVTTQMTATGGAATAGAFYQWGTGTVAGSRIIAGQTAETIALTPTGTTSYWVRRVDATPCSFISAAAFFTITVKQKSTAPTILTGTTPICNGTSTRLVVSGGSNQVGALYEWSTGSVAGENVIASTTVNYLTVSPTETTQYWVRRLDATPCNTYTDAISKTITVDYPAGDPAVFGDASWNVYGYNGSDLTLRPTTTSYRGYYTNPDFNFDSQTGTNGWDSTLSPSTSAGWSGCLLPNDYYTMVAKRQGFPCGTYALNVGSWDDSAIIYLNGIRIWSCSAKSDGTRCNNGVIGNYYLDRNSTIEIRVRELTGTSNISFSATLAIPALATAPTSIAAPTTACSNAAVQIQATGGETSPYTQYEWGTGAVVGSNVIGLQVSPILSVNPSELTTYWVRRVDDSCQVTTDGVTVDVQVDQAPVAGTLSGDATVCSDANSTTLTLSDSQGNIEWQSSVNNIDFTTISGATTATFSAVNLVADTYYRAISTNGVCAPVSSNTSAVTVNQMPVSGTLAGGATVCSTSNDTMLTISDSQGNIQWQSAANAIDFTNIDGATSAILEVANLTATTNYRAVLSNGVCVPQNTNTQTIVVNQATAAGTLSGDATVCSDSNSTTITLTDSQGSIEWQSSANNVDFSTVSGETNATYVASNLVASTFYRAVLSSGVCSSSTSNTVSVSVDQAPVAGTLSGGTTVCSSGNDTTLTISGSQGNIQWQSSANNIDFTAISGATSTTFTASNLTATTYYRAVLSNGVCSPVTTNTNTIAVDQATTAGTITGSSTVCATSNSTTLNLVGSQGNIEWQSSTNNTDFTAISGATSASFTASNLTATNYYRAVLSSGVCAPATTDAASVVVNQAPVAGTLSGGATVCSGSNSTAFSVSGSQGNIQWQSSTNNTSFTSISGATSATYTAINLNRTTYYRAVVSNAGVCTPANTSSASVIVNQAPVAGTISGLSAVCSTGITATLTLSGSQGNIQWQSSSNNVNFTTISGATNATYLSTNSNSINYYRATLSNGVCTPVTASTVSIAVNQAPVAGTASGASTVCASSNSSTLTVTGSQGTIQWQQSTDNVNFTAISGATSSTYVASNLTTTTYFRASLSNGVCTVVNSNAVAITVQPTSVAGTLTGGGILDSAINNTTLTLNGSVGSIRWESSANNTNFTTISGQTANTLNLVNLGQPLYVRAVVTSGICSASTSNTITLLINTTVGGTLSGNSSYCQGSSNNSTLNLTGQVGSVLRWESSINADFSGAVTSVNNTTTSLAVTNILSNTYYRAVVSNNGFPFKYSSIASITMINSSLTIQEIQGLQSLCGTTQTTYSVPTVVGATNYVWTFPAGISATTNTAGNSVLVNVDPLFQDGTITVKAFNACSTTSLRTIDVVKKPVISSITGPVSTCGSSTATYSAQIAPVDATAVYTWSVPTGFTIISGAGTSSITVSIDNNVFTTSGYVNVSAVSSCGTSPVKFYTVNAIQVPSSITGREEVCGVTSTTYSTPANASVTSYIWTVPTGMSITAGQGTNQITVAIDQNAFTSGNVSVANSYSCGTSLPKTLLVNKAQKPGNIVGPSALCGVSEITYNSLGQVVNYANGNAVYSIPAVQGATSYTWVVPQSATIISGQGTNTISVSFNYSTFVSGTVSVYFTNQCGNSVPSTLDVKRTGTVINGFSQLCNITSNVTYTVPTTVGSNFTWRVPSWMTIVSGQSTNLLTVSITGSVCSDSVYLDFVSNCNTNETISLAVGCGSSTKVDASFCGTTIASEYTQIYANTVTGATSYKFRLVKGAATQFITSSTATFSLNQLTTWAFGDTFTVDVAPIIGGVQGGYGCSCSITLAYPVPAIQAAICGTTLSYIDNRIYCSAITSASSYRFEVSDGATVRTFVSTSNSFLLSQLTGGAAYGVTYTIRAASNFNNVWSAYGASCNVTTPSTPTSRIDSSVCGTTLASLWTTLYASQLAGITVQSYRFEVTNLSTNAVVTYDSTVSNFSLMLITGGAKFATSYAIRVAVKVSGTWQQYGASCTVNTPGPTTKIQASQCGSTISNLWTTFYADDVTGATGYSFEVTNGTTVRSIVRSVKNFSLMLLTGGATINVTYSVRVAAIYNGTLQAYGPVCTITTVSPTARTIVSDEPTIVFDARVFPNPFESNFGISIDTSSDQMISIRAFDMLGKELQAIAVAPQDLHTITLGEQYPTGVYQLIVTQGNDSKVLRVIKR
ncbi:MAG: hypothetical protein CFE24_01750 [Flavobacterium sp. BFFFF2]|nr:MAG: hypothetical protein CFE24_01750 [Flavobacterium sp. BFFFF2]